MGIMTTTEQQFLSSTSNNLFQQQFLSSTSNLSQFLSTTIFVIYKQCISISFQQTKEAQEKRACSRQNLMFYPPEIESET
jgi:hypothetical protein